MLDDTPLTYLTCNLRGAKPKVDFDEPWQDEAHLEPQSQAEKCRQMWCWVLFTALKAIFDLDEPSKDQWLGSEDFRTVCALAGMEPDAVLDRVGEFILRREIPPGLYKAAREFAEQERAAI